MDIDMYVPTVDIETLLKITIAIFTIKGFFLLFLFRIRNNRSLYVLAWGCFLFAFGWFLFFFRFSQGINVLALPVADLFIFSMPVCLILSIFYFLKTKPPIVFVAITVVIYVITFILLVLTSNDNKITDLFTSFTNSVYYFFVSIVLTRRARSKSIVLTFIRILSALVSIVLLARFSIVGIGWFCPGSVINTFEPLLTANGLFFYMIFIDSMVLCFPILEIMETQKSLSAANLRIEEQSRIDDLTSVYNRKYLSDKFASTIPAHKDTPFSLILFDLDHFKNINDTYGHLAGDVILQQIASLTQQSVRVNDRVVRFGGEEFIVLLPETSLAKSEEIANRLRTQIAQLQFDSLDLPSSLRITSSFGVTATTTNTETLAALIKRADALLYKAKSQGRNRVCA